jgi:hypothetical protein
MKLLPGCESHKVPHDEVVDAIETDCKANSELRKVKSSLSANVGQSRVWGSHRFPAPSFRNTVIITTVYLARLKSDELRVIVIPDSGTASPG